MVISPIRTLSAYISQGKWPSSSERGRVENGYSLQKGHSLKRRFFLWGRKMGPVYQDRFSEGKV